MNDKYNTYEKVKDLFTNRIPDEEWNTFFIMFNYAGIEGTSLNAYTNNRQYFDGLLIGLGNNGGIAFYKLLRGKMLLKKQVKNMSLIDNSLKYFPKSYIDRVDIKYSKLNKKVINVHLRFTTNESYNLKIKINSVDLPYQNEGIHKFINKYKRER
ncbi:MAG: hypothetical protein VZS44_02220 [Bacilli bacterium]|nr:hypothetical protein [Bacilli bacterium]